MVLHDEAQPLRPCAAAPRSVADVPLGSPVLSKFLF